MAKRDPFKYFKSSPEIIRLAVMLYVRFPLSLRIVEDLLHDRGEVLATDRFPSYMAALRDFGCDDLQACGRWLNNCIENSPLPFRRRERAMQRFRVMRSLQKFVAVHSSVFNHFDQGRTLSRRDIFKLNRTAALAEWHSLGAA